MARIVLVHWNQAEATQHASRLKQKGLEVAAAIWSGADIRKATKAPVDAIVISLERLPSHGAEMGKFIRQSRATRHIPLLYIEGPDPTKSAKAKLALPDAIFTSWDKLAEAVKQAKPVDTPVVPTWSIASDKPLVQKLGILPNMKLSCHGEPGLLESLTGELPDGVRIKASGKADLWFWFVRSVEELRTEIDFMSIRSPLWICWKKGAGGLKQPLIRQAAKAVGMVDYKICAMNKTWSGMLFRVKEI